LKAKQIVFTDINKAELLDVECRNPEQDEVIVKMDFSTISQGTERANITGDLNTHAFKPQPSGKPVFPRFAGYSNSGIVHSVGRNVTEFKVGDRVAGWWGSHKSYCEFDKGNLIKLDDEIGLDVASIAHIACFPMGAIRKTHLEIGESAIVFGLGILGMLAMQELRAAGADPIIAVDPIESRRKQSLENGADVALNCNDPAFVEKVKALTEGGAHIAIEVTGSGKALDQALDVIAPKGRIALLGCTRDKNFTIDYYRKVHGPGVTLIGAHTASRPRFDSYPGFWTVRDEMAGILRLQRGGRIHLGAVISEVHSPLDAPEVYRRMLTEREFPIGVQFNWSLIE
jgi:threonine dehydrogenase-like Zn-dependent dehydrogenase